VFRYLRIAEILWYGGLVMGMTGFDGADRAFAASRGALTSQIQSKNTTAKTGKAFSFPVLRTNALALAA